MGIYKTFLQNITYGPMVPTIYGELRYQGDCNLDDYGNWIPKSSDKVIQDLNIKSKKKGGIGWLRAYELL